MAMVECAECGKEVSDKAANCPSCGAPIAGIQVATQEKEHSVRSGAITGLIGAVGYPIVLGILMAIQDNTPDNPNTISVNPAEGWTIVVHKPYRLPSGACICLRRYQRAAHVPRLGLWLGARPHGVGISQDAEVLVTDA